jgi:hypothetical protein
MVPQFGHSAAVAGVNALVEVPHGRGALLLPLMAALERLPDCREELVVTSKVQA